MGQSSSCPANTESTPNGETIGGGMARGKTEKGVEIANVEVVLDETFSTDEEGLVEESDVSSDTDDEEEEEEEEDEEMMERLRVLEDARKLKQLAEAFLYPERPVVTTDPTACARNYFNRGSVPEVSVEEAEEHARILEDAKALKKLAVDYAHPELPVETTDETACSRCYFDRASAPEQESVEEAEERARILEDVKALKQQAVEYLHPEMGVVTTEANARGRNYFDRASAPEEAEERDLILQDMRALKKFAVDYAHPELPVVTTEVTACGRNYFDRDSAPEQESMEEAEERARAMEELQLLKKLAVDYAHPELSVFTTDDTACGRLYFNRASAAEEEDDEEAEERDLIMQDLKALKKLAIDYLHPELAVVTTDETACSRNYFGRASAEEMETLEEAEERAHVLEEMQAFKKWAVDFAHPELPVVTSDPTLSGRSYFGRASAPDRETDEDAEERARIMEDAMALKKFAMDYAHPELPVGTTDSTIFGRNYFGRVSAPEQMSTEEAEAYDQFLVDAMHLKKFATDYLHPELPVVTSDETAGARSYFGRASAEEIESMEEAEERVHIMEELKMLKQVAVDYAHPELPVVTTDATARGRNYFVRASAPGHTCISSTREEDVKIIDDNEEDYFLEGDLEFGDFEEEVLMDWKYQVHKILDPSHYSATVPPSTMKYEHKLQGPLDKEEEGKLSRSPSSVMLFGGGYEQSV